MGTVHAYNQWPLARFPLPVGKCDWSQRQVQLLNFPPVVARVTDDHLQLPGMFDTSWTYYSDTSANEDNSFRNHIVSRNFSLSRT